MEHVLLSPFGFFYLTIAPHPCQLSFRRFLTSLVAVLLLPPLPLLPLLINIATFQMQEVEGFARLALKHNLFVISDEVNDSKRRSFVRSCTPGLIHYTSRPAVLQFVT